MANNNFVFEGPAQGPVYFTSEGGAIGANLVVIVGTAAHQIKLPGAADVDAYAVTAAASTAAGQRQLCFLPGCFVLLKAAAAISAGARVGIHGTTGKIKASSAGATTFSIGIAYDAAGADGDLISVWFSPAPNNT